MTEREVVLKLADVLTEISQMANLQKQYGSIAVPYLSGFVVKPPPSLLYSRERQHFEERWHILEEEVSPSIAALTEDLQVDPGINLLDLTTSGSIYPNGEFTFGFCSNYELAPDSYPRLRKYVDAWRTVDHDNLILDVSVTVIGHTLVGKEVFLSDPLSISSRAMCPSGTPFAEEQATEAEWWALKNTLKATNLRWKQIDKVDLSNFFASVLPICERIKGLYQA